MAGVYQTNLKEFPCRRGKVRDVYDIGEDRLAIVTTDRISAFDWVMPNPVPDKGKILTNVTKFWFNHFGNLFRNHFITSDIAEMPRPFQSEEFDGRTMIVEKCTPLPIEFIYRGYLCGSGWNDYKKTGKVCGHSLPSGLQENSPFPYPLFTPSTKADVGHDMNITVEEASSLIDKNVLNNAIDVGKHIFSRAQLLAWHRGIIIADTKFEFGLSKSGELTLIDEVLTPDSSRYWPVENYVLGKSPPSLDKQYVRDYLSSTGWDKNSDPPTLPEEVVSKTREKYKQIESLLTKG
jgi:phosphoribosylaminoimidazole-succinocarboxamide synthase